MYKEYVCIAPCYKGGTLFKVGDIHRVTKGTKFESAHFEEIKPEKVEEPKKVEPEKVEPKKK